MPNFVKGLNKSLSQIDTVLPFPQITQFLMCCIINQRSHGEYNQNNFFAAFLKQTANGNEPLQK
jgi:hypothetical protein